MSETRPFHPLSVSEQAALSRDLHLNACLQLACSRADCLRDRVASAQLWANPKLRPLLEPQTLLDGIQFASVVAQADDYGVSRPYGHRLRESDGWPLSDVAIPIPTTDRHRPMCLILTIRRAQLLGQDNAPVTSGELANSDCIEAVRGVFRRQADGESVEVFCALSQDDGTAPYMKLSSYLLHPDERPAAAMQAACDALGASLTL